MDQYIPLGFCIAGLVNICGAVGTSRFFTNPYLAAADPKVMSNFGLLMVVLWGCAYLATAAHWRAMRWLVTVFAIEKAAYAVYWLTWITSQESLGDLYEHDFMTGLFLTIYGPNDLLFALFFAVAFLRATQIKKAAF